MVTKTVEKTVVVAPDGTALSVMERPEGLGTVEDYFRKVDEVRKQYAHLFSAQSQDDHLAERRLEAEREWKQ